MTRQRRLHRLAVLAYLGLLAVNLAWEGWLAPAPGAPTGLWVILKTVPLLLPLFGVLHGRPRALFWASLLLLLYFTEGVVVAYAFRDTGFVWDSPLPYALIETALSLVFIASAGLHVRGTAARSSGRVAR